MAFNRITPGANYNFDSSGEPRITSDLAASATMSITTKKIKRLLVNCYPTLEPKVRNYFNNLTEYEIGHVKAKIEYLLKLEEKQIISEKYGQGRRKFILELKKKGILIKKSDEWLIRTEYITRLIQNLDPNFSDTETLDYFNNILLPFCKEHVIHRVDIVKFGATEAIIKLQTLFKNLKEKPNIPRDALQIINLFMSRISNELKAILVEPVQDDTPFQGEDTQLPFDLHQFQSPISQESGYLFDILSLKQELNEPKNDLMIIEDIKKLLSPNSNPTPLSLDDRLARNVTAPAFAITDPTDDDRGIKKRKTNSNEKPEDRT